MQQSSARVDSLPIAAGAAAVGGALVFIGVFMGWFSVTLADVSGNFVGTRDWSGVVAVIAGAAAIVGGGAAMMLRGNRLGALGAGLAAIGGVFGAAMTIIALVRVGSIADGIAGNAAAGGSAAAGLWLSFIGGLVAMVGGWQAQRSAPST